MIIQTSMVLHSMVVTDLLLVGDTPQQVMSKFFFLHS